MTELCYQFQIFIHLYTKLHLLSAGHVLFKNKTEFSLKNHTPQTFENKIQK